MSQPPSSAPDAAVREFAGARVTKGAPEHAGTGAEDVAVVPLPDLFQRLHSTDAGLRASDAAAILETVGPNQIGAASRKSLFSDFVGRFSNPLVLILLFAAAVSAFSGDVPSFVIIATIVLMSVILDVTQERQAQNAAERLREQVSLSAKALRDGLPVVVPAAQIVPGDVVLAVGDLVPTDARLIEARDLYVDEALLTGRAVPGRKGRGAGRRGCAPDRVPAQSRVHGKLGGERTAKALVLATGRKAQLGSIASALQKPPPPTAFAIGIQKFGMMIVQATIFLVLFVVLINHLFHRPLLEIIPVRVGARRWTDARTLAEALSRHLGLVVPLMAR